MDRSEELIRGLDPVIQNQAIRFINLVRSKHLLPAVITSGRRTPQEQQALLSQGRTTTLNSQHVVGHAFDVDMYGWNRDRVPTWVWDEIGPAAESIGLRWGGRWKSFKDVGHFEL
jgi:hypothetical protein